MKCPNYRKGDFPGAVDGKIHYVNLSMYPAPCQSRCIYCDVCREPISDKAHKAHEKLFDTINLANKLGIIDPNATWQVSSGEIAVHPYRKEIMQLVRGKRAVFYTNCMKYDEAVAQNLHDNPASAINLSIEAGTPATWKRVKGADNFETVTTNLVNYFRKSAHPGQITLKYIVMPDVNDFLEDFTSVVEIMKLLEVKHLTLSRDVHKKYSMTAEDTRKLTGAAAYLLALCHKNGISNDMFTYTAAEQEQTVKLANEILQRGMI